MARPRGRIIDERVIEVIEYILDNWNGKLTWDLLIVAIKASIATGYTRQALSNHERIAAAFSNRKKQLAKSEGRPEPKDARFQELLKKIDTLSAENARLENECKRYRAKFIRWTQNALIKGITEEQLDANLPPIDRKATETKITSLEKRRKANNGK